MKLIVILGMLLIQGSQLAWAQGGPQSPELEMDPKTPMTLPNRALTHPVKESVARIANRVKPGMAVLDIGAGLGDFSFEFAKLLRGTGQVYATDVDPPMISKMKEKAQREGVTNVVPVQVDPLGLDPFYRSRSFDLVMASRVYHSIVDPVAFFGELRASLKPEARLFIIDGRMDSDFQPEMFVELEKNIETLRNEGESSLFFARFSPEFKKVLLKSKGQPVTAELKTAMLAEVNCLLEDRSLFRAIRKRFMENSAAARKLGKEPTAYRKYAGSFSEFWHKHFTASDQQLALWLVGNLESAGAFNKKVKIGQRELRELRFLNKMLIHSAFVPRILENPAYRKYVVYYAPKEALIRNMEQAGYKFIAEHPHSPYFYFLEFANSGFKADSP